MVMSQQQRKETAILDGIYSLPLLSLSLSLSQNNVHEQQIQNSKKRKPSERQHAMVERMQREDENII